MGPGVWRLRCGRDLAVEVVVGGGGLEPQKWGWLCGFLGEPQKCTDHNLASERQQAHTRKRDGINLSISGGLGVGALCVPTWAGRPPILRGFSWKTHPFSEGIPQYFSAGAGAGAGHLDGCVLPLP
jgi:hypothetical protein